jgi:nitroreductase
MDVIRLRRSVREFTDQEINDKDINTIIEAGICAPSAKNQQPWEFIVIKDKNILNKLSETLSPLYAKSKVTIILCSKKEDLKSPTRVAQDMSACMQNMMLEATKLGIGSCWIGTYPDPERMNPLIDALNIPSNIEPFCGLVLGYPKNSDAFKEIKRDKIVHFNKYNA